MNPSITLDGDTLDLLHRATEALRAAGVRGVVLDTGEDSMNIFRTVGETEIEGAEALLDVARRRVRAHRRLPVAADILNLADQMVALTLIGREHEVRIAIEGRADGVVTVRIFGAEGDEPDGPQPWPPA